MSQTGLNISAALIDEMLAHAAQDPGIEICGLLMGKGDQITSIHPCRNVATDQSKAFEVDPAQLIAIHRQARQHQLAVIGHYHSHPNGREIPSERDRAMIGATGEIWIILANGGARAFVADAAGKSFAETTLNRVESAFEPRQ